MSLSTEFISQMDELSAKKVPYFFVIDYSGRNPFIEELDKLDHDEIMIEFPDYTNVVSKEVPKKLGSFKIFPPELKTYQLAFEKILKELQLGNSYLVNLTFQSEIICDLNLREIFYVSKAPFKLFYKDHFVVFSPEQFCYIKNNYIYTYPMKGTIEASVPHAAEQILSNRKEMAEHATIVDLLRNDLSIIAEKVKVQNYRYITSVKTTEKELLQVSSEIQGHIKSPFRNKFGSLISKMLPAGSVTGAPKHKTIDIINQVENYERGYYTGVMGVYDGKQLNTAVMIRFIEKSKDRLYYKSGGGLTSQSNIENEYNELIQKVYVPVR